MNICSLLNFNGCMKTAGFCGTLRQARNMASRFQNKPPHKQLHEITLHGTASSTLMILMRTDSVGKKADAITNYPLSPPKSITSWVRWVLV